MENLLKKIAALFQKPEENPSYDAVMEAKQEVAIAWSKFNEVTRDEYIDIAIMNLNLAKKRLDVAIKESKEAAASLSETISV